MSNTIKYIGIALAAGVLLCVLFFIGFFALLGYEIFGASNIEYYRGKFLLTATVEVDGKIKTGSSVYEVSYNRRTHGGGQGLQISPINGAKGSLPVINLGKGNYLVFSFLSFTSNPNIPETSLMARGLCSGVNPRHVPTTVMIKNKTLKKNGKFNIRKKIDLVKSIDFDENIDFGNYSLTVYHARKNEPYKDENNFLFCDAGTVLGSTVKPISLTIEKTQIENAVKNDVPNWLSKSMGYHFHRDEF